MQSWEIYYIKKFNTFRCGYNSTLGGEGASREKKQIKVYDNIGNYIETLDDINEITNKYKTTKQAIRLNCERFSNTVKCDNK